MTVQNTFTQDQIKFLSERLFDVMSEDFDYKLKPSKRKALMAKVMGSPNFDALLQRSKTLLEDAPVLETHYRWLKPVMIEGEQRYMPTGDDRYDESMLSDLIFDAPEKAYDFENLDDWGYSEEDLEGLILVKVTMTDARAEQKLVEADREIVKSRMQWVAPSELIGPDDLSAESGLKNAPMDRSWADES
jgi:hypothetical protein